MGGVVYALIDNTWDERYALPFCATFSQENDQIACIRLSAEYLVTTFENSPAACALCCAGIALNLFPFLISPEAITPPAPMRTFRLL